MKIAQADTAIDCYRSTVPHFSGHQRERVLRHIEQRGPATLSEIAAALSIPPGTVSARATELRNAGLLEWGGRRESIVSGVTCKTLRLPRLQLELC